MKLLLSFCSCSSLNSVWGLYCIHCLFCIIIRYCIHCLNSKRARLNVCTVMYQYGEISVSYHKLATCNAGSPKLSVKYNKDGMMSFLHLSALS